MTEEKKKLLREDPELAAALAEIPEIISDTDYPALSESWIPLKRLFAREQMDRYHIDSLILKKIALSMLAVMKKLSAQRIYPGLFDMEDILCNIDSPDLAVCILHPDRFQLYDLEQDYEWYPEDERLLGDIILLDREAQQKADQRLLCRILTGSARGNVTFPPARSDVDYAQLFYNILPDEWKQRIEKGNFYTYEEMKDILTRSVEMEESMEKKAERNGLQEELPPEEEPPHREDGRIVSVLILMLQTDSYHKDSMGRLLYDLQEELGEDAVLCGYRLRTGVVYGDGTVRVKDFFEYPPTFRFQYISDPAEYSAGESMIVASEIIKKEQKYSEGLREAEGKGLREGEGEGQGKAEGEGLREGEGEGQGKAEGEENLRQLSAKDAIRVEILVNGRINNDTLFRAGLQLLSERKTEGVTFRIRSTGDVSCEAFTSLQTLTEESL